MSQDLKIGLSTTGSNQNEVIKKALDIEFDGVSLFETFQVTYNILDQSLADIAELLEGKRMVIKEALANGRLFPNTNYKNYEPLYQRIEFNG